MPQPPIPPAALVLFGVSLTGHTTASVGRKYGDGVPLEVLAEAVAKVNYKGLDLSHLHLRNNAGANS